VSQALHVAAQLGLADLLKEGPRSVPQLAEATGAHARSLYRLLRALAGVGAFAEDDQGRFALAPLGDYLRSDHPESQRPRLPPPPQYRRQSMMGPRLTKAERSERAQKFNEKRFQALRTFWRLQDADEATLRHIINAVEGPGGRIRLYEISQEMGNQESDMTPFPAKLDVEKENE
jgi:hypothetical protein